MLNVKKENPGSQLYKLSINAIQKSILMLRVR